MIYLTSLRKSSEISATAADKSVNSSIMQLFAIKMLKKIYRHDCDSYPHT